MRSIYGEGMWKDLIVHRILQSKHARGLRGPFLLCDVLSMPSDFKIFGSSILKRIWEAWKRIAPCLMWNFEGSRRGLDLSSQTIWSWRALNTPIAHLDRYLSKRLCKKCIFAWKDLWDEEKREWKDWSLLSREKSLLGIDRHAILDL